MQQKLSAAASQTVSLEPGIIWAMLSTVCNPAPNRHKVNDTRLMTDKLMFIEVFVRYCIWPRPATLIIHLPRPFDLTTALLQGSILVVDYCKVKGMIDYHCSRRSVKVRYIGTWHHNNVRWNQPIEVHISSVHSMSQVTLTVTSMQMTSSWCSLLLQKILGKPVFSFLTWCMVRLMSGK